MPVNMAVVKAASAVLAGGALADVSGWLNLLVVYNVIMTTISIMVFAYVIQE